jgi:ribosomal protein S12 methylthiotransferase|uniref:Ribosomal protein uS12 methylthiotransferase RimO n=1 Tax=Mesoaciditoga lauensis TaxID=1495039 RepID=A0A7V3VTB9_9BACT
MRIWMDTLGCPKNEADSDVIKSLLIGKGYEVVEELLDADLAIINTCAFISDAKEESVNEIFNVINGREKKSLKIIVHGCLVQRYFKELRGQIPEVDSFLGIVSPEKVVEAVKNIQDLFEPPDPVYKFLGRTIDDKSYAYVKIGDGCDRRCTFCAIPNIKGPLKNRDFEEIIKEIRYLVDHGKKEIILVSQDLTNYSYGGKNLIDLLRKIDDIDGDFWVRLLYLYPDGVSDDLVEMIRNSKKILHYFDIPLQHASEKILKFMNRTPSIQDVERKLLTIREKIPDAILRTTFIVGFPGEDEDDFEKLMKFVRQIQFDRLGAFIYSDEEGTGAFVLIPKVRKDVAKRRISKLMNLQKEISFSKNERLMGKKMKVIVDEVDEDLYTGRTYMDAPEIDGYVHFNSSKSLKVGDFVQVRIESYEFYDLEGSAS